MKLESITTLVNSPLSLWMAYARQETETIAAAFRAIEEVLVEGDEEVRTAAAIGFLGRLPDRRISPTLWAAVFVEWLGPKSKGAWAEIEEMWRGKSSPMDVVRAEQRAAKDKLKS